MAMYHLSAKTLRRSAGRSATGAAAYRAGERIVDERTGLDHDYTRKSGVLGTELCFPGGTSAAGEARAAFWNRIEHHHRRKDAVVAREVEVSLPTDLDDEQRRELALEFAQALSDRYGIAVDMALHAPRPVSDRDLKRNPDQHHMIDPDTGRRHNGNWHAHLLLTACHVKPDGTLGKKCVELDPIHCQRHGIENMTDRERGRWADMQNAALERAQTASRVDHRSYADRDSNQVATVHLGGYAARMRREGTPGLSENAALNDTITTANQGVERLQEQSRHERIERYIAGRHQLQIRGDMRALAAAQVRVDARRKAEVQREHEEDLRQTLEALDEERRALDDAQATYADFQQHEQIAEQFAHEHRQRLNRQAAHDEATASAPRADRLDSQSNDKKQEPMPARKFPTVVGKRLSDIQGKMETAAEERDSAKSAERDAAQAVSIATAELEQIRGWFKKRRRREATQRLDSAQERHAKAERHTQAAEAQYASLSREYRQLREKAASIQPGSERSTIRKQRFQPPAPTPEAKTAQQPQRETWHELEKRAQAAIDEVLSNPNRHERAALIRQAVTHDDERYAEAFEEAMIERGIGVHGELSPAAQREQQQREQQPSDKEMSQHIEHAREDLSGPGSRNGGPSL